MKRDLLTDEPIEDERYELQRGPGYVFLPSRREFVGVLGGGILIAVASDAAAQQPERRRGGGIQPAAVRATN